MRKRSKNVLYIFGFLFVCIFISAGAVSAEVGVTDTEVLIGSTMDQSGPIAFMGSKIKEGAELCVKYINDQGGVNGRKIRFICEDDGYQSPRAVQAAKKLITKDKIFCMMGVLGAASTEAMYPLLVQYNVPLFIAATQNDLLTTPPRKLVFLRDTGYTIQAAITVKYLMETMKAKNVKPAIIYQDDITGLQYRDGVKKGFAPYGIKDIPEFSYKRGAVDFSSQVAKCKELGITHVFCYTIVREPAMILKEAERIQFKATYFTSNASVYAKTLELAGKSVDYTNGYYGISVQGDPNSAGYKLYKSLVKKYNMCKPDEDLNIMGFSACLTTLEIIKRAGRDLTREGAIEAAETFRKYDVGLSVPITWRPDRRDGGRSGVVCKAEKGQWVRLTGWIGED